MPESEYLDKTKILGKKAIDDVRYLNNVNGVGEIVTQRSVANLGFVALAYMGEAGELGNKIKKLWRDGESEQLWKDIGYEIVDNIIYLIILLDIANIDLDQAWTDKFQELNARFLNASPKEWLIDKPDRPLLGIAKFLAMRNSERELMVQQEETEIQHEREVEEIQDRRAIATEDINGKPLKLDDTDVRSKYVVSPQSNDTWAEGIQKGIS